jgi:hypothetical protein
MSRSLSCAILIVLGAFCGCATSDEVRSGSPPAFEVDKLVEQLVSHIGPPPPEVKDYNGGKTDMKKLEAYFWALSEGWMAPQVAKAREKLIAMGTPIFPDLVKHLGDKRYSYSFCSADWVDYSVGSAVEGIMAEVIGSGFNPWSYKWRDNPSGSNGQPNFSEMMADRGGEKYADHARRITTREAEREFVQWYMEKEKSHGFVDQKQQHDILAPCLKRLSEL